jgi:hypothetical protein
VSVIASFYVVARERLIGLAAVVGSGDEAGRPRQLAYHAAAGARREIDRDEFLWSGNVMVDLLDYLTRRGLPLLDSELNAYFTEVDVPYVVVFTAAHKRLLPGLDPAAYTPEDMREAMRGLGLDAEEAEYAVTDGLTVLRAGIAGLADDELLMVQVG